jgi:hypothetical protein
MSSVRGRKSRSRPVRYRHAVAFRGDFDEMLHLIGTGNEWLLDQYVLIEHGEHSHIAVSGDRRRNGDDFGWQGFRSALKKLESC